VSQRRQLLDYLRRSNEASYKALIEKLGIRRWFSARAGREEPGAISVRRAQAGVRWFEPAAIGATGDEARPDQDRGCHQARFERHGRIARRCPHSASAAPRDSLSPSCSWHSDGPRTV